MRTTVAHRHTETLRRAQHHIGAQLTRRGQQQQAEQIGRDAGQRLTGVQLLDERAQVVDLAVGIRILQQGTEHVLLGQFFQRSDRQLEAEGLGAGLHHRNGLRMAVLVDEEAIALALGDTPGQGHRLGGGGRLVEQRGIGQIEPGQVDDHLLVVQQRL